MKSFTTLITAMARGPSKPLLVEMEQYCFKNGLSLIETFFETEEISPKTIRLWTTDADFMDWLAERLTPPSGTAALPGRRWFYKDQPREELVRQSVEVVAENFISAKDTSASNAGYLDFRIVDPTLKTVEPLLIVEADRMRDVARALRPILEGDGYHLNESEAKTIWSLASIHGSIIRGKPTLCAQPDEEGWCLHRISVVADGSTSMPETQRFLDRINDPEAFAAWLYGIASGRYVGRQILWLTGPGSDGKSTFFKSFASIFGSTAGSVDWITLKDNAGFAGSLFVNKRFVYVPDNNNPELLGYGLFKSLSDPGSDPVTINHKYGKMYSTELEANTAVLSNFEPAIRNETHSLSRSLYLTIEPRDLSVPADKTIVQRFIAELPAFLTYGRDCYERRCLSNTEIKLNEAAQATIDERIASTSEKWDVVFNKFFVLDDGESVSGGKVYELLTDEARLTNNEIKDFRTWMKKEHGVGWRQVSDGLGKRPRVYQGIRLRTPADDLADEVRSYD